ETMEFPMTVDYSATALFLRDLGPYDMPVGGTAIVRALTAAQRLLERASRDSTQTNETESSEHPEHPEHKDAADAPAKRSRVVILLTDGEDHEGDPVAAAQALAKIGARVYVVGI